MRDARLDGELRDLERRRLRSLVEPRLDEADALHSPDFQLVHPGGGVWSRAEYLGGIASGRIDYRRFEAISDIEVMVDGALAVLRYRSAIDIAVEGQEAGALEGVGISTVIGEETEVPGKCAGRKPPRSTETAGIVGNGSFGTPSTAPGIGFPRNAAEAQFERASNMHILSIAAAVLVALPLGIVCGVLGARLSSRAREAARAGDAVTAERLLRIVRRLLIAAVVAAALVFVVFATYLFTHIPVHSDSSAVGGWINVRRACWCMEVGT